MGQLDANTYTVKYEMEDGETVNIGNLVLDSTVYYSVTSNLTNCTINNSTKTVAEGGSYSATITANDGYELKSVTVTMGGTAVSVSGGVINIASVTGDIVITAVAEEVAVEIVNQIPISTDASGNLYVGTNGEAGYKTGYRLSSSSGNESASNGAEVTGFIPAKLNDTIYIEGITVADGGGIHNYCVYNASKTYITGGFASTLFGGAINGEVASGTLSTKTNSNLTDAVAFIRISAGVIDDNSILTVNEPIE